MTDVVNQKDNRQYFSDLDPSSELGTLAGTEVTTAPLARRHLSQKQHYRTDHHSHIHSSQDILLNDSETISLAIEAAIAIVINGIHYAVLMASPSQIEYLAVGFLFSEGLIRHSHELLDWEVSKLSDANKLELFMANTDESLSTNHSFDHLLDYDTYIVELTLNQRCHQHIQAQRRQLAGRTGCGMCGITGLSQALPDLSDYFVDRKNALTTRPSLEHLLNIREQVNQQQDTHLVTGAVHGAATLYDDQLYLFEDVGRHNALDKLVGWQIRHKEPVECVVMTSRLSIELVQKSIRLGIPWLVGMSAPTSTAVRVAKRYGLGLAGFLRANRVTYYSGLAD